MCAVLGWCYFEVSCCALQCALHKMRVELFHSGGAAGLTNSGSASPGAHLLPGPPLRKAARQLHPADAAASPKGRRRPLGGPGCIACASTRKEKWRCGSGPGQAVLGQVGIPWPCESAGIGLLPSNLVHMNIYHTCVSQNACHPRIICM